MTDDQLANKFKGLAKAVLPARQIEELLALCWCLEKLDDVAKIARASVPA